MLGRSHVRRREPLKRLFCDGLCETVGWGRGNWAEIERWMLEYPGMTGIPSLSALTKAGMRGLTKEEAREEVLAFLTFFFFGTMISSRCPFLLLPWSLRLLLSGFSFLVFTRSFRCLVTVVNQYNWGIMPGLSAIGNTTSLEAAWCSSGVSFGRFEFE